MTILTLIVLYVLNVFIGRWLNKITYLKGKTDVIPSLWFLPLFTIIVLFFIAYIEDFLDGDNWFNGSRW